MTLADFKLPGSWKTTAVGVITAVAAYVMFDPQWFPGWMQSLAKFVTIGGLAAFGIVAKDANVTGGTVANTKNNPTIVMETATESAQPPRDVKPQ